MAKSKKEKATELAGEILDELQMAGDDLAHAMERLVMVLNRAEGTYPSSWAEGLVGLWTTLRVQSERLTWSAKVLPNLSQPDRKWSLAETAGGPRIEYEPEIEEEDTDDDGE